MAITFLTNIDREELEAKIKENGDITPGTDGEDGFSPIANVTQTASGAVITITDKDGTTTATVINGRDGVDGYTPVKGVDYFDGTPGKDGAPGADGYTPIKGVDYFDGEDGQDGSPGKDGISTTHSWNGTILTVTSASGTSSANLKGETGATGQRGTGLLPITTAPSSYTTAVGEITPKYRIAISTIKSQAGATEVFLGDTIRYSYYHYPIAYLDDSYAYCTTRVSIRGAAGTAGAAGAEGKSAYAYAQDGGYTGTEQEFAEKMASSSGYPNPCVMDYGAKGDGATNDTKAFQDALAENRVVFVPGGTYKLNGELVIGDNCCLELSQDAVLEFTQTSGNCIVLGCSSVIKGNWATVNVPYTFSGNVVYSNSADSTIAEYKATPPFKHWTPMWKSGRIVDKLNICKAQDGNGLHISLNGDCAGTAVYFTCDGVNSAAYLNYMWSAKINVRVAGAFSYGIRATNINKGWNNDLRVMGYIDACEIGVSLEDCIGSVVSVFVQPRASYSSTGAEKAYAKHGIQLIRSRAVNLNGSRVWDWDAERSLWTNGGQWQHIAMYGECKGLILDDFLYHEMPSYDIRNLIYTDTPSNLEKMTILQEPIDRWFKVKDGVPYYHHDNSDKKLALHEDLALFESHFDTDVVKNFTDVLSTATDTDGSIFNGIGYKKGGYISANGTFTASSYYVSTGFIPCKPGDEIHIANMNFNGGDDNCRLVVYDANQNYIGHINRGNIVAGGTYHFGYRETDNGCVLEIKPVANNTNVAYARFSVYHNCIGEYPMVAINEEIKYTMAGFLADTIKVKGSAVVLSSPSGKSFALTVDESGALSTVAL